MGMADDGSIGGNYTMFFWLKNPLQVANGSRYVDVQYLTDGASFLSHHDVCSRCPSVAIANIVALLRGMLHAHALFTYFLISVKGTCVEMAGCCGRAPVQPIFTCLFGISWLLWLIYDLNQAPKRAHALVFHKSACYTHLWQRDRYAAPQAQSYRSGMKSGIR